MDPDQEAGMAERSTTDGSEAGTDTPAARRAARISAARALVKVQQRLGKTSLPSVVALANADPAVEHPAPGRRLAS